MSAHSLDAADRLVRQIEATGVQLEPRGEHLWVSDMKRVGELGTALRARRDEVLRYLRLRAYERLTSSARILAGWLDDTGVPLQARRPRLPEYEQLLEQISALEPWMDQYWEKRGHEWTYEEKTDG